MSAVAFCHAAHREGARATRCKRRFMTEAWRFRDGTLDKTIFNIVVLFNEYRLPPRFAPGDIVIDVGAHIGSFAHAVLSRGCENVTCIEADRTNFEIAAENLRPAIESGHVQLVRGAAWRSDRNTDELRFDGYHLFTESYPGLEGILNTGNGSVDLGKRRTRCQDRVRRDRRPRDQSRRAPGTIAQAGLRGRRMADLADLAAARPDQRNLRRVSRDRRAVSGGRRGSSGASTGFLFCERPRNSRSMCWSITWRTPGSPSRCRRHRRPTGALEGLGIVLRDARAGPACAIRTSEMERRT